MAKKINWMLLATTIVGIVSDTGNAMRKDSEGGKKITPEERDEIFAAAMIRFRGLLEDVFPALP